MGRIVKNLCISHGMAGLETAVGGVDVIHHIAFDITINVFVTCVTAPGSGVACVVEHIERIESGEVLRYMSKELYRLYMSLNGEERDRIKTVAVETLEKFADELCDIYLKQRRRNGNDICDFI